MAKGLGHLGEIRLPVSAAVLAALGIMAVTGCYYWLTKDYDKSAILFVAVVAAACTGLSAFYSARALQISASSLERERDRQCKALAFQFTSKWNDPALFHVRDTVRELFANDHNSEAFQKALAERQTNIIHFLNFLEEIAIAIEHGADERILKDAFRGVISTGWSKLNSWVGQLRQMRNNPRIWVKVEALSAKWN